LILVVLIWIPFGVVGEKLLEADLGSAVLGVVVGYVLGHVLQILAQGAFPSKFSASRGSKLRYPSDVFLDEDNPKLIAAFKRQLLEKIDKDFQLDVRDSAFLSPRDANLRQATRDHAFRLCRSALLRGDKFSYAEQFNGMYVLMRGLVAAFLVAAFFYIGWTVGWTAKYFADPEVFNQMTTLHGLIMVFGAIMPAFVGFAILMALAPASAEPVLGSVGYRIPYTDVVIRKLGADGDLGGPCAPHEIGVLTISGPHVTPGYRDPSHNASSVRDGYLDSGDLAYTDEAGRIFIAGRSKDLIIRSGHNIDPVLIESALEAHPAVALAAAVGQPDRYAGELPVCYVALRPGAQATAEELKAFAEPLIAERPAWPKHVFVIDAIPMTSVGKIFKPALRIDAARRVAEQLLEGLSANGQPLAVRVVSDPKHGQLIQVSLGPLQGSTREQLAAAVHDRLSPLTLRHETV
jgi:hypothetical protein